MERQFLFEGFLVQVVDTPREINFEITVRRGFVCRLVPRLYGFDLSPVDKALGNYRGMLTISRISEFILDRYA